MNIRFFSVAAMCTILPVVVIAQPAEKKPLVGVWEVKVLPAGQSESPFLSLAIFSRDGSFTTSVGPRALPPIRAVQDIATELGSGYGQWVVTAKREFRLTFYSVMWKAGLVNGYQRVEDTLVLSETGEEFTGHAQVDFLDSSWSVVFSTTSDVKGTRLETPIPTTLLRADHETGWYPSLVSVSAQRRHGSLNEKQMDWLCYRVRDCPGHAFRSTGREKAVSGSVESRGG
jgi:hypothetical protein